MPNLIASSMSDPILVGIARHRQVGAFFILPNGVRIFYQPMNDAHHFTVPILSTCYREGKDEPDGVKKVLPGGQG